MGVLIWVYWERVFGYVSYLFIDGIIGIVCGFKVMYVIILMLYVCGYEFVLLLNYIYFLLWLCFLGR